jgi:hypothetical protein
LTKYCETNAFYLDIITMGKAYVHFFSKDVAEKVYNSIKSFPSQFQDCELKLLPKKEEEDYFKKIYKYLKDANYFNYVNESREGDFVQKNENEKKEEKKEKSDQNVDNKENKSKNDRVEVDDEGFVIVKSKKNK